MNFVELLVSLQWNKNYNTVKNSKSLLFKLEALYERLIELGLAPPLITPNSKDMGTK